MVIFFCLSMISDHSNFVGDFFIVGDYGPTFSVCTKVLAGIKTETPCRTKRTCFSILIERTVGLAGIFYNVDIVLFCYFKDLIHIRRLTVHVHRNNGFGF